MHELNICHNILNLLQAQANKSHFHRIKTLWLEIGDLAGIEIDALQFSFPIAASSTLAKDATLEIIRIPGRGFCKFCKSDIAIQTLFSPCLQCHNYDYHITQGKELRILKMEVE